MNIRNQRPYLVGLDMGTGSVGWAAADKETLDPCHYQGNPMLGSRLFSSAESAADTRLKRGQRRRYERRKQRIQAVRELFAAEMAQTDPDFFAKMNAARLWPDDREGKGLLETDYQHVFFKEGDPVKERYQSFKTIWHLRQHLMETDEKEDIRLIYLAIHNIVKYRGNFLREEEGESLKAANANSEAAIKELIDALHLYYAALSEEDENYAGLTFDSNEEMLKQALENKNTSRAVKRDELQVALGLSDKSMAKELAGAFLAYKVEFSRIFPSMKKQDETKFEISSEDNTEKFLAICPEEALASFIAIQAVYSAYVLSGLLRGQKTLSAAFIASYKQHHDDLAVVKKLVKDHFGKEIYNEMFRGETIKNLGGQGKEIYNPSSLKAGTYTAFIEGEKKTNHEDFLKALKELLTSSEEVKNDSRYESIREKLESKDPSFLAKQKTRLNGQIPYQLHLEELNAIIDNQGRFYPWLLEEKELLGKIVSSRIPYYVGPLNTQRDPEGHYVRNPQHPERKFGWATRRSGTEGIAAHPWNVEEVIDTDKAAEDFILRMTGTCTYLYGELVLPRHSLLYEEFCVLNELNGARWADGNDKPNRFDSADREAIMNDLFKRRKSVSAKAVKDWLKKNHQAVLAPEVSGMQGESGFESKLEAYVDFCKIFSVESLEQAPISYEDIERIILWSTVFEDRKIMLRKLNQQFGDVLSPDQIKAIAKKRYQGWGRLSGKLLMGITDVTKNVTVMDVLREGNPLPGKNWHTMILQEVLTDKKLGFFEEIEYLNKKHLTEAGSDFDLSEIPGSPALRRSINQTLRVVEEIVEVSGREPSAIYIEETRDDEWNKKGKRTDSRYKGIKEALNFLREETALVSPALLEQLEQKQGALNDEKMMLYFMQGGKSLYSGKPLDINCLSDYQVDHILPQCYIKDDSFENKALVLQEENQQKLDSLFLPQEWQTPERIAWWRELQRAKLITPKKFKNLTRTSVFDGELRGFINRQLVETSQVVKYTRQILEARYPDTKIVTVRASLGHELRESCGFVKCREINNYHHAHDAYLAIQLGYFIGSRYPKLQDGQDLARIRQIVKTLAEERKRLGVGDSPVRKVGSAGFFVSSFLRDGFDKETGEITKDTWDADAHVAQIRKVLSYKKLYVSHMTEEQTGAFWDETVYSPYDVKEGKSLAIPLRESGAEGVLDPHRYGGKKNERQAYFFLFRATDKKGKAKYFFEGVPVRKADLFKRDDVALRDYAEGLAKEKGCSGAVVLKKHIPLRQKMLIDGCVYLLGGKMCDANRVNPSFEYCPPSDLLDGFYEVYDEPCKPESSQLSSLYEWCTDTLRSFYPKVANVLKLEDRKAKFDALLCSEQATVIKEIVAKMTGQKAAVDLKLIGGSKACGAEGKVIGSIASDIVWIDQSVTGMHEKRSSLEDLEKWASEQS